MSELLLDTTIYTVSHKNRTSATLLNNSSNHGSILAIFGTKHSYVQPLAPYSALNSLHFTTLAFDRHGGLSR